MNICVCSAEKVTSPKYPGVAHFPCCTVSSGSLFLLAACVCVGLFVRPVQSIYGLERAIGENAGARPMLPVYTCTLLHNAPGEDN